MKKSESRKKGARAAALAPEPVPTFDRVTWGACLGFLLLVWAALYLPYLRNSPRWYGDEFVTLMGGNSIVNGTFANRALRYSFFSGFTNYQPAGCFLYALAGHVLSGGDIYGARLLATVLGFLTAFTAFHLLYLRGLIIEGLAGAVIILAAPEAVVHFRWVYPHYFVSLGVVLAGLMLDQPRTARRDWIIGLGCAVAALGHLLFIHVTLACLLVRWRYPSAWLRIGVPPAVVALLSLTFGYIISGKQLFADISEVGLQYTTHNDGNGWDTKFHTFFVFFTWDWLHVAYIVGLVILAFQGRWALVSFALIISIAVIQNRPELPIFYYQAMIFAPLLGVCLACGLQGIYRRLADSVPALRRQELVPWALAAIVPGLLLVETLPESFGGGIISRNNTWVAPSDHDLETTAAWVNEHAQKDDFVVAFLTAVGP